MPWPSICAASTSTSPRVIDAVLVRRTDGGVRQADRPDAAFASEQRAERIDGDEKVAAVLLHHREQQVAAGVSRKLRVRAQHRQARQEHASRFAFVRRQRQRAFQDVARRQHTQLVAKLARTAAAVEHRDDGVSPAARGSV